VAEQTAAEALADAIANAHYDNLAPVLTDAEYRAVTKSVIAGLAASGWALVPANSTWTDHLNAVRRLLVGTPPNVDSVDAAIGYALNDCEAAIWAALGEVPRA
jgi:hypothetical protein